MAGDTTVLEEEEEEVLREEDVEGLSRRQLQQLCKARGIKANSKTVKLVADLKAWIQQHQETVQAQQRGNPTCKEESGRKQPSHTHTEANEISIGGGIKAPTKPRASSNDEKGEAHEHGEARGRQDAGDLQPASASKQGPGQPQGPQEMDTQDDTCGEHRTSSTVDVTAAATTTTETPTEMPAGTPAYCVVHGGVTTRAHARLQLRAGCVMVGDDRLVLEPALLMAGKSTRPAHLADNMICSQCQACNERRCRAAGGSVAAVSSERTPNAMSTKRGSTTTSQQEPGTSRVPAVRPNSNSAAEAPRVGVRRDKTGREGAAAAVDRQSRRRDQRHGGAGRRRLDVKTATQQRQQRKHAEARRNKAKEVRDRRRTHILSSRRRDLLSMDTQDELSATPERSQDPHTPEEADLIINKGDAGAATTQAHATTTISTMIEPEEPDYGDRARTRSVTPVDLPEGSGGALPSTHTAPTTPALKRVKTPVERFRRKSLRHRRPLSPRFEAPLSGDSPAGLRANGGRGRGSRAGAGGDQLEERSNDAGGQEVVDKEERVPSLPASPAVRRARGERLSLGCLRKPRFAPRGVHASFSGREGGLEAREDETYARRVEALLRAGLDEDKLLQLATSGGPNARVKHSPPRQPSHAHGFQDKENQQQHGHTAPPQTSKHQEHKEHHHPNNTNTQNSTTTNSSSTTNNSSSTTNNSSTSSTSTSQLLLG